ncbi:dihydrofolate reductase family protein [Plantactinospora sp. S1510]|uniref:Dihydrofolate reductase family protein n=1 Tax=Plantactinospora alkalitolerans TaxID=2789879 RepID=A0ABS0H514_9ACTN|nr:dihydrofolate reductase family protein [Plantactinospora alkalitolerans]MBF9133298.1 dihydrofolate reductase family protein [Plantactinospora alkalitolerans]
MGRLFLHINVSLDGYVNDADGEIDWHFSDEEFQRYLDDLLGDIDGMMFGRVAFEELAGYWPNAGPEASPVQVRRMHELPKYVLSRTLEHSDWHNSHVLDRDPAAAITELKRQSSRDIALFAGGRAASAAAGLGVIDEYRLVVNPVLLGGGTRLFDGRYPRTNLRLTGTRQFTSGALLLTYEPAAAAA